MPLEARIKSEHQREYPELDPSTWYGVAPIFPGVTQRMVNMAGDRLARLITPRGFLILKADHLDYRSSPPSPPSRKARTAVDP